MTEFSAHPQALVSSTDIGPGTRIWAFVNVQAGARIGANCNVGDHCFIESGARIGDNVTVKNGNMIWDGVTLEDGVFVGPAVVFTNDLRPRSPRHPHGAQRYETDAWLVPTRVGEGASIGAGAVILPGLAIGAYAFVAAAAVVTRSVPNHALIVGSPARTQGWVCKCGATLDFAEGDRATCREDGLRYRLTGDLVTRA